MNCVSFYIPFTQSLHLYLRFGLRLPPQRDAVMLCQPAVGLLGLLLLLPIFFFSLFFCIIMLSCVCVCVFVSCVLRGSFRLIKEMIYRSTMLEEFPDRSSNHVSSNELSPLNHSRPPKRLAPKTHPYVRTHTHTRTHTHLPLHVLQHIHASGG